MIVAPDQSEPRKPLHFWRTLGFDSGVPHPQPHAALDLRRIKTCPLAERRSLTRAEAILIPPTAEPPAVDPTVQATLKAAVAAVREARRRQAAVMLIYGAHLLRNGAALIVEELLGNGWVTHLATNGAGTIHDWEYAWLGRSTESVRENVATGTFGTWEETGRNLHLAMLAGGVRPHAEGYGRSLGRFICEDGVTLPAPAELKRLLQSEPEHPATPARADLLQAMLQHGLAAGRHVVEHR